MVLINQWIARAAHVRAQRLCAVSVRLIGGLFFALAWIFSGTAWSAPAYVQGTSVGYMSGPHTITAAFPGAQTAGNLNVVAIGWIDTTSTITGISDSKGNAYVLIAGPTRQGSEGTQYLYYAKNIAPAAAGENVLTITISAESVDWPDTRLAEYSGVDIVSPLDGFAAAADTGSMADSGPIVTTSAGDLIVGVDYVQTYTTGPGSGFTERIFNGNLLQDRLAASAGTYSSTAPIDPSGWWVMQAAAFKASAPDVQAPTSPGSLSAVAASSTQINLSWSASSDNFRVTHYRVERCAGAGCSNFAEIGTTYETSFSDNGLSASSTYTYRVRAQDATPNFSGYSSTASATTLAANTGIRYVQGAAAVGMPSPATMTVAFPDAQNVGDLNVVTVSWSDAVGTITSVSDSAGNTYTLAIGPTRHWEEDVTQYIFYAKNIVASAAGANTVTAVLSTGEVGGPVIRVAEYAGISTTDPLDTAVGLTGNGSNAHSGSIATSHSNDLIVAVADVENYATGPGVGYTQRYVLGGMLQDKVTTSAGTHSASVPFAPPGWWVMHAVAFKGAGGGGGDTEPPSSPNGLSATAVSSTAIDLSWAASTDNVAVTGYRLERCTGVGCSSFSQIATPSGASYSDSGLAPDTSYTYRVRAVDAVPNVSGYSSPASATTQSGADNSPPAAPASLVADSVSSTAVTLTWSAATDNVGVTGYRIERCLGVGCTTFALIGTSIGTSFSDPGRAPSTTYRYRVRAEDAASNLGAYSPVVSVTTAADTQAPGPVSSLVATAASDTQINLSWQAATDDVAVAGYLIERCTGAGCTSYAEIASVGPATTFADNGLSLNTTYRYRVRARDQADNRGSYSNVATATTAATPATHKAGAVTYQYDSLGRLKQVTVIPQ